MTRAAAAARQRAFTLIEILVVVTIMVIIIGVVVLSVNLTGRDSELHRESKRVDALIRMGREQAEMQVRDYGIYLEKDSYRFMIYDPLRLNWLEVEDDSMLRHRSLPDGLEFELVLEGHPVVLSPLLGSETPRPQLLLFSSGDVNSFDITMKRVGTLHRAEIRVLPSGAVEFTDVDHMPEKAQ